MNINKEYVKTILLERENTTHNLHVGEEATLIGFGKTSDVSNVSPVLNEVDGLTIITNEQCAITYGIFTYSGIVINLKTTWLNCFTNIVESYSRCAPIPQMERVLAT